MSALDRIVALAKAYNRVEHGKLEHVGQYESRGPHPDDVMALREHMEKATQAWQRGDFKESWKQMAQAKEHAEAGPGHGNKVVHGVAHKAGKHDPTTSQFASMGKSVASKSGKVKTSAVLKVLRKGHEHKHDLDSHAHKTLKAMEHM